MPGVGQFSPKVPGQLVYPKYAVVTTIKLAIGTFTQGKVYNANASGYLDDTDPTSLANGFFQAMTTPSTQPTVAGDDTIQVAGPRTRMLFTTQSAGLRVGADVIYVADSTNVVSGAKSAALYIGKIFEIYSQNTDGSRKSITEAGDKVVVETVQA